MNKFDAGTQGTEDADADVEKTEADKCFAFLLTKNQLSAEDADLTNANLLLKMAKFLKTHQIIRRGNAIFQYTLLLVGLLPFIEYLSITEESNHYETMSLFFSDRNSVINDPLKAHTEDVKQMIGLLLVLMMSMDFKRRVRHADFKKKMMIFCHAVIKKKFPQVSETVKLISKHRADYIAEAISEEGKSETDIMDSLFTSIWVEFSHRTAGEPDTMMFTVNIVLTLLHLFGMHDGLREKVENVPLCFGRMVDEGITKPNSAAMKISSLMFAVSHDKVLAPCRRNRMLMLRDVAYAAAHSVLYGWTFEGYIENATGTTHTEYFESIKDNELSDDTNESVKTQLLALLETSINSQIERRALTYADDCMQEIPESEDPPQTYICLGDRIGLTSQNFTPGHENYCLFFDKEIFPRLTITVAGLLHQYAWNNSFDVGHTAVFFCIIYYISNIVPTYTLNSKIESLLSGVHIVHSSKRQKKEPIGQYVVNTVFDRLTDCADTKGTKQEKQTLSELLKIQLLLIVNPTKTTGLQRKENKGLDVFKIAITEALSVSTTLFDCTKPVEIPLRCLMIIVNASESSKHSRLLTAQQQRMMLNFFGTMAVDDEYKVHLYTELKTYQKEEGETQEEEGETQEEVELPKNDIMEL